MATKCEAEYPELLTSTRLRKYLATVSQVKQYKYTINNAILLVFSKSKIVFIHPSLIWRIMVLFHGSIWLHILGKIHTSVDLNQQSSQKLFKLAGQ
jgi:hypothetical protein